MYFGHGCALDVSVVWGGRVEAWAMCAKQQLHIPWTISDLGVQNKIAQTLCIICVTEVYTQGEKLATKNFFPIFLTGTVKRRKLSSEVEVGILGKNFVNYNFKWNFS